MRNLNRFCLIASKARQITLHINILWVAGGILFQKVLRLPLGMLID
jgi:hypothetical protein